MNRCAGFNNVNVPAAVKYGIRIMRVPAYSPHSVAEHAIALLMALNRKTHIANERCRNKNFDLQGLEGFALHGKTVAVIGAGKIGILAAKIYIGFGCEVLYYNRSQKPELDALGATHMKMDGDMNGSLGIVCEEADVISIHILLNPATFHMLGKEQFARMKKKPMIINVARGDIIDTKALVAALQTGQICGAGLDVVEGEADIFFGDHGNDADAAWREGAKVEIEKLLNHDRCMVTGHQAFLTHEALSQIATISLTNARDHLNSTHPEREICEVGRARMEAHSIGLSEAQKKQAAEEALGKMRRAKWKKNISKLRTIGKLGF